MSDDNERQATISSDTSRPVATGDDSNGYSLSIEDALALYEASGLARTRRSIQRYCARGDLDAHRVDTEFGDKFLITRTSIERHISYIKEVRPDATSRDLSGPVATNVAVENVEKSPDTSTATSSDAPATSNGMSRQVATDSKIVELLERENELLRDQLKIKDKQIAEQSERARETNVLFSGLQRLVSPLLSGPDGSRRNDDGQST